MNTYRHSLVLLAALILPVVTGASARAEKTRNGQGFLGVSVVITNGTPVIAGGISESMPAFKAGLRLGDKILSVDGKSTDNLELPEVVNLLRGGAGTKVTLTILTPAGERKKVTLKRAIQTQAFIQEIARREQEDRDAYWIDFKERARAWRALTVKPVLSEETQKQRILAENAVLEKRLDDARTHYYEGLQACLHLWPNGLYNLAILLAEIQQYSLAAHFMKSYLEMVPDAPDARAMRAKIIIWEDKWTRLQHEAKEGDAKAGYSR